MGGRKREGVGTKSDGRKRERGRCEREEGRETWREGGREREMELEGGERDEE